MGLKKQAEVADNITGVRKKGVQPTMARKRQARNHAKRRDSGRERRKEKQSQISLCMIVKDEEDFLPGCLESVRGVVDEIVLVDTGSTDRTVEIAREFGAKVYQHKWNDDFAAARNESLKHATCGWILVLDADERLDVGARAPLKAVAQGRAPKAIYACRVVNRHDPTKITEHVASRFFPSHCGIAYKGVVHERPLPREGHPLPGGSVPRVIEGFVIVHEGYREDVMQKRDKHDRNTLLLEQALAVEDNSYYRYKLGATLLECGRVHEAIDHLQRTVHDLGGSLQGTSEHAIRVHALLLLSQAYLTNGELGQSRACAEEALSICRESRLAQYHMGLVLFELARLEESRDTFARLAAQRDVAGFHPQDSLGFDPSIDTWKSRTMAARCCLRLGDPVAAAGFLAGAAHFFPRNPEYIETVRQTVSQLEAACTRAGTCDEKDVGVLKELLREEAANCKEGADDHFGTSRYASALKLYAAALALGHPPDGALLARVAACLVRTGRVQDGFATYLKALKAAPTDPGSVRLLLELTQEFREGMSGAYEVQAPAWDDYLRPQAQAALS